MSSLDAPPAEPPFPARPGSTHPRGDEHVTTEQAEAALVEHYPRLVRLAYVVLSPALGRHRRVLRSHALVQRALPRGRLSGPTPALPAQRQGSVQDDSPGYTLVRLRALRAALAVERAGGGPRAPRRLPPVLPHALGLRLFPRSCGADELALEQALSAVPAAARAAYALQRLEGLSGPAVSGLLRASGVREEAVAEAMARAEEVAEPPGERERSLLWSPEFDPCSLQARPTDLMRRRQHARASVVSVVALILVMGVVVLLPGGRGPDGAAAPPYARNTAAEAALDPGQLLRAPDDAWRRSSRSDFSVWPARGPSVADTALLRRALAVWARPGHGVDVSATAGTATGPAAGPAQLLYAGETDGVSVVLLHDGMRLVRYAEPADTSGGTAVLDFARTDGADQAASSALVLHRADGQARLLLAPWVEGAGVVDLAAPADHSRPLDWAEDGVTRPVSSPAGRTECTDYPVLTIAEAEEGKPIVLADLGELLPAQLTFGAPGAEPAWSFAAHDEARTRWARTACHLPSVSGSGVRSVNVWAFADQELPDGAGTAHWVCTRAETWRGSGSRVTAQFQPPTPEVAEPGAVAAQSKDGRACGPRDPRVLSGVRWKSPENSWYLLAAGSEPVTGITAVGEVTGRVEGRTMALPATADADAQLTADLASGDELGVLR